MRVLFSALLLVLLASLKAAAAPAAPPAVPADDEPNWTVGVSAFAGRDLSPENLYLLHSFPLALRERLSSVALHFFTPEERAGYQRAVIRRAARKKGSELEKLRRERDALFFRTGQSAELTAQQADQDRRLEKAVEELAGLAELDPAGVVFPDRKEVRFADGQQGELLLPEADRAPLAAAAERKLNLLIHGHFEEIQDYLYLEVRAVDTALEREVYRYTDAVGREGLGPAAEAAVEGLTRILWGREWASLAARVSPPEARIYLDGTLLGAGEAKLDFVSPGEHTLRLELEGYHDLSRQVEVAPYSLTELDLELEKLPEALIAVGSLPEGAALYKGSTWLGITPLEVPRPEELARFLLRLEGFRDEPLYLGPSTPASLAVDLKPAAADPLERQKSERNRFYTAFGLFALALPLPIFSWRYVTESLVGYQSAVDGGDLAEAERLLNAGNGYYYAYLGTLGLTIGLAGNMLIQLVRYIRAADRRG
jgi:hypothetical protein